MNRIFSVVRSMYDTGEYSVSDLAEVFSVSLSFTTR